MSRILVIDDDRDLCELLSEYLRPEGFDVEAVSDGGRGVERALSGEHALLVLDVMLPELDGFEVLRRIRAGSSVPVLMLTARGDDADRIVGLEIGADDYLPKPFNPRELVARIRAILRRSNHSPANGTDASSTMRLTVGDVELEPAGRAVWRAGEIVDLTPVEFDLLETLLRTPGQVVARELLFEKALGRGMTPLDRSVDMHVSNLRKKLGPGNQGRDRIEAVRGVGYIYRSQSPPAGLGNAG